jgi:DNA-binding IclR family transcriptional regulator
MPAAKTDSSQRRYHVQPVERALDLLSAFTREEPRHGLAELSRRTGLTKPTVLRLIDPLLARGLVHRTDEGDYTMGAAVLRLASACEPDLRERATPILRKLRDELGETAIASIRAGDDRVHVAVVESQHPYRRSSYPGDRAALYLGSASKVLMAAMTDDEIRAYARRIPLQLHTGEVLSVDELLRQVNVVRAQGWSDLVDQRNVGGASVAAPVLDHHGVVVAALHVSIPLTRYSPEARDRALTAVLAAAAELSSRLGYYQPD